MVRIHYRPRDISSYIVVGYGDTSAALLVSLISFWTRIWAIFALLPERLDMVWLKASGNNLRVV